MTGRTHMSKATRISDLRRMLNQRRDEVRNDLHSRVRRRRSDGPNEGGDDLDHSDHGARGDLELALALMRADTVTRIDHALVRLDAGKYGSCLECSGEISERRLRALPFAVRCQACEVRREQELARGRTLAQNSRSLSLFPDGLSP